MSLQPIEAVSPPEVPEIELASLSAISLEDRQRLPSLFDYHDKINWVLGLQFVKFRTSKLKQQFMDLVTTVRNIRYLELMFWYLLLVKLPIIAFKGRPNRVLLASDLRQQLQEELSKRYVELFMSIAPPKQKPANMLLFFNVYFCLKMYSETFRQDQMDILLTPRFMLDCFHVIVFEALGLEVSDRYIELNLQELFVDFFESVMAEETKRKRLKEATLQKERRMKADRQTDFFEGKINRSVPQTMEQSLFLRELEEFMNVPMMSKSKKRSVSISQNRSMVRKESKSTLTGTKSSFGMNNELKRAEIAVVKRLLLEEKKKQEEEHQKVEFLNQIEKMQTSRSSQSLPKQNNSKQTLSLVGVGPCVSSYLNLRLNKVPGSTAKYINHPEQKILTNDYLRQLLKQVTRKEEIITQVAQPVMEQCDIGKPMKGMTLMEITSYRLISEKQRDRQLQPRNQQSYYPTKHMNPEQQSSHVKLPPIEKSKSRKFRRPQVLTEEPETKRQDIFVNLGVAPIQSEVPEGYKVAHYKNQLNQYKRDYRL